MLFYDAVKAVDAVIRDSADLESSVGWRHENSVSAVFCGSEEAVGIAGIENRQVTH